MTIIGERNNEIGEIAGHLGISVKTVPSMDSVDSVNPREPLWILPASYPKVHCFSSTELNKINKLVEGGSRVMVEFDLPLMCPDISVRQCHYERLVIRQTDHPITERFQPLDLFEAHQAWFQYLDIDLENSHELLSIARVSGFDFALFGLPEKTFPCLVEISTSSKETLLWSSTSISSPHHRRYKPISRWKKLIEYVLLYLNGMDNKHIEEKTSIKPLSTPISDENRLEIYKNAIDKNLQWYHNANILINNDGSGGVLEGLATSIDIEGNQTYMLHEGEPNERGDCNIQSAFAFLEGGDVLNNNKYTGIGENLLDFTISNFQYRDKSVYSGLWRWFKTGYEKTVFYADDNGWAGFFTLFQGALTVNKTVLESGIQTAVALRETWGSNGHRRRRIDLPDFYALEGRKGLRREAPDEKIYKSPHYEASAMAVMALSTILTGDNSFIDRIIPGLDDYIEKWPDRIFFQHSENDDASKFAVALFFAFAATGKQIYKNKAMEILQIFIEAQLENGAIPDIDRLGNRYGKNRSNSDYGTFESSVFQRSTDLVTDQVYGTSFMLLALFFAEIFIPEKDIFRKAKFDLADYLVQIQLKDTGREFLDGAWMRAFDPVRWEYYGAAGDWGYGPYLMETGWCQAIIVLGLSWIIKGKFKGYFDETVKHLARKILKETEQEHQRIEENWKENTPNPVERVVKHNVPDVMI